MINEDSSEMPCKIYSNIFSKASTDDMKSLQNIHLEPLNSLSIKTPLLKRNYTITHVDDIINIQNERCPTYALFWEEETNKEYWPQNHNFYVGNNKQITQTFDEEQTNMNFTETQLGEILSKK